MTDLDLHRWREKLRTADVGESAAASRWGVPALLDEIERLRAVVDRAERDHCGCLGYPLDHPVQPGYTEMRETPNA